MWLDEWFSDLWKIAGKSSHVKYRDTVETSEATAGWVRDAIKRAENEGVIIDSAEIGMYVYSSEGVSYTRVIVKDK